MVKAFNETPPLCLVKRGLPNCHIHEEMTKNHKKDLIGQQSLVNSKNEME